MKILTKLASLISVLSTWSVAYADEPVAGPPPAPVLPYPPPARLEPPAAQPAVAAAPPVQTVRATTDAEKPALVQDDEGWHRPVGHRLLQGIRIGYNHIAAFDEKTRDNGMTSLKDEFKLKTPHTMILGYELMYRVVGHSWLNVIMVGNVSVAGLEQSKFIPTANGLIGAEFQEAFQLGVGVNLIPDEKAPTHMIAACGWTPRVGSIYTPVHFFFVPDADGNHRAGATVGVTW